MHIIKSVFLATTLLAFVCSAQTGQAPAPAPKPANPAFHALVNEAGAHVRHIDTKELGRMISEHGDFVLIDVRETEEWQTGHAAGAVHISRGILEPRIEGVAADKNKRIVLYCSAGMRSALAAESLQRMGYTNVWSLDGGFTAYKAAGLPIQ